MFLNVQNICIGTNYNFKNLSQNKYSSKLNSVPIADSVSFKAGAYKYTPNFSRCMSDTIAFLNNFFDEIPKHQEQFTTPHEFFYKFNANGTDYELTLLTHSLMLKKDGLVLSIDRFTDSRGTIYKVSTTLFENNKHKSKKQISTITIGTPDNHYACNYSSGIYLTNSVGESSQSCDREVRIADIKTIKKYIVEFKKSFEFLKTLSSKK